MTRTSQHSAGVRNPPASPADQDGGPVFRPGRPAPVPCTDPHGTGASLPDGVAPGGEACPSSSPREGGQAETSAQARVPGRVSAAREGGPATLRPGGSSPAQAPAGGNAKHAAVPLAGQARIAAAMSEDRGPTSLDAHVRKLVSDLGLRWYHTHDSRRSPSGFPDLVIVGRRVIYRELKRESGKPSPAQEEWLGVLAEAGEDVGVWRPSDLLSGRIARELVAISGIGRRLPRDAA